jgi:hypothetical protein
VKSPLKAACAANVWSLAPGIWFGSQFGRLILWLRIPVSRKRRRQAETGFDYRGSAEVRSSICRCRDHSAGMSQRRATPIPRGSRSSMAALTRSGARNASEIVMLTFRALHIGQGRSSLVRRRCFVQQSG